MMDREVVWLPEDRTMDRRMVRNSIRCTLCLDEIESKHRHDWQQCTCGAVFVDGGLEYQRIGGMSWEDTSVWEAK